MYADNLQQTVADVLALCDTAESKRMLIRSPGNNSPVPPQVLRQLLVKQGMACEEYFLDYACYYMLVDTQEYLTSLRKSFDAIAPGHCRQVEAYFRSYGLIE